MRTSPTAKRRPKSVCWTSFSSSQRVSCTTKKTSLEGATGQKKVNAASGTDAIVKTVLLSLGRCASASQCGTRKRIFLQGDTPVSSTRPQYASISIWTIGLSCTKTLFYLKFLARTVPEPHPGGVEVSRLMKLALYCHPVVRVTAINASNVGFFFSVESFLTRWTWSFVSASQRRVCFYFARPGQEFCVNASRSLLSVLQHVLNATLGP